MIDGQFHLTFMHTVLDSKITTYFAFVYPFSYTDLQKKLDLIESRLGLNKFASCYCFIGLTVHLSTYELLPGYRMCSRYKTNCFVILQDSLNLVSCTVTLCMMFKDMLSNFN